MEIYDNFQLIIDDEKMSATLHYRGPPIDTLHKENILPILREKNIIFGIQEEKIESLFYTIKNSKENILHIKEVIARGILPEKSIDGSYTLLISLEPKIPLLPDGKIDHKNIEYYKIVHPNDKIVILRKPYKGKNGINIHGEEVPSRDPAPIPIKIGKNIELMSLENGNLLGIAKIYGILTLENNTIDIMPELIIPEDASLEKGNLKFKNNIHIKGNVLRGLEIFCEGDLNVEEIIESGHLRILGNIFSKGINTGNMGTILCKKNIKTNFIENTHIVCEGDIIVNNSIMNSNIISHNSILMKNPKSTIIGGKIMFFYQLECGIIGNSSFIETEIYAGYHYNHKNILTTLLTEFKKIEKDILELSNELNYYTKLLKDKHHLSEKTIKNIKQKIEVFKKLKETYTKKKKAIEYLKLNCFNHKEIIIQIYTTLYPGVCFYLFDKKFPIEKIIHSPKIKIDISNKILTFL